MAKHSISNAEQLYYGAGFFGPLYAVNGRKGAPVALLTKVSLGSPAASDDERWVKDATAAELPNNGTKTYTPANAGSSPCDDAGNSTAVTTIVTSTGESVSVWAQDVARNIIATTTAAAADTRFTISGYDQYRVAMSEVFTIATAASTGAGTKAFKYIASIAIYSAGDITSDTVDVGFGDVLGLPYKLATKADCLGVWFNDAADAATIVVADATEPATPTTTGDVRGTIDTNSAADGSAVVVWMYVADPSTKAGLLGVDQA